MDAREAMIEARGADPAAVAPGVFSAQSLRQAIDAGWIDSDFNLRNTERLQAASLDLTLGAQAWRLRCSFLPDGESDVETKLEDLAFDPLDLRDGALLERNRPYLIPLAERLRLPDHVRGRTNPKSSTGRLDVFTRVITHRNNRFDEIKAGYEGPLYLEVVPRSFAIRVRTGLALNQLRLVAGDSSLRDPDLRNVPDDEFPLLYVDGAPVRREELPLSNGLFLSLDLRYHEQRPVGFRAKATSRPVDMSLLRHYDWREYWEPVVPERAGRFVLEPEQFYLLLSREGVSIPPTLAAEMAAYDPTAGELRTHYAGFFDPGFGHDAAGTRHGSRAALEVRAHDVPFMVEDGQPVCKLTFERLDRAPDSVYGEGLTSHYQGQETMLSKHFADQTAGLAQLNGG
jgi:dCTP deaminase